MRLWAAASGAAPHDTLGTWTHIPPSIARHPDKVTVVLNLNGDAGIATLRPLVSARRIFSPLVPPSTSVKDASSEPPAATFLHALAAYAHLVRVAGVRPSCIVLVGGTSALALARYLAENAGRVPGLPEPPGALLLVAPGMGDVGLRPALGLGALSSVWLDGMGAMWKARGGNGGLVGSRGGLRSFLFG
jgi:hypothetical protein